MTTTLVPALGHGPLTQQGTGATPGYDAIDARRWTSGPSLGEGVTTYGSFRVSQRAAGANLSVDINMDDFAYVRGDAVTLQGLYQISPHASTINETGAGAVPSSALLLADVLVAATDTAISNAEIRDRRAFVSGVPSILTAVDMVAPTSPLPLSVTLDSSTTTGDITFTNHDTDQVAGLIYIPRRIASATRLRWKYVQGATALAGSYVFAVFDASGRKIIDTGSVAFAGAINTWRSESVTITATTFEAGWYYGFFGSDTTVGGVGTPGWGVLATVSGNIVAAAAGPNMFLGATGGGLTVPTTLASFTDMGTSTSPTIVPRLPQFTLSVG
jgi:hypothetical protein